MDQRFEGTPQAATDGVQTEESQVARTSPAPPLPIDMK